MKKSMLLILLFNLLLFCNRTSNQEEKTNEENNSDLSYEEIEDEAPSAGDMSEEKDEEEMQFKKFENGSELFGVWYRNGGSVEHIPAPGGYYEIKGSYLIFDDCGTINDFGYHLSTIKIEGDYPYYTLHVECGLKSEMGYDDDEDDEKDEWPSGIINVNFIDEDTFWLEDDLSEALYNRIKRMNFSMRFGEENKYYRAKKVEDPDLD